MAQPYSKTRHPVRNIPTREQIAYAARRQAIQGADDDVREDEDDILDEAWSTRLPTSTRRYQDYTVSPEAVYQSGNTRYHVRYADVPKRKSRRQLPPSQQPERYTEEVAAVPKQQHNQSMHPLLWFGLFLTFLLLGWIGLNFVTAWYQGGSQRRLDIRHSETF